MEQFERIRRDARDNELSIRALADKHKVHRRTVRAALADAVPPVRKPPARVAPVLGPYEATIRGWLVADLTAPRKQRHTARRVWQSLLEEHGAVVAESSVRNLVAQLKVEVGGTRAQVMVPQTHPLPGTGRSPSRLSTARTHDRGRFAKRGRLDMPASGSSQDVVAARTRPPAR